MAITFGVFGATLAATGIVLIGIVSLIVAEGILDGRPETSIFAAMMAVAVVPWITGLLWIAGAACLWKGRRNPAVICFILGGASVVAPVVLTAFAALF